MVDATQQHMKEFVDILVEKNAKDIVSLDMRTLSFMTDYFLICSGTSERHLQGIARGVQKHYKASHHKKPLVSGYDTGWVLVDCGDVVIHIFRPDVRDDYNLEELWSSAKKKRYSPCLGN